MTECGNGSLLLSNAPNVPKAISPIAAAIVASEARSFRGIVTAGILTPGVTVSDHPAGWTPGRGTAFTRS
jgi:hypothetical protein